MPLASPLQPTKDCPPLAVAVRVTAWPSVKTFPTGARATWPPPVIWTVKAAWFAASVPKTHDTHGAGLGDGEQQRVDVALRGIAPEAEVAAGLWHTGQGSRRRGERQFTEAVLHLPADEVIPELNRLLKGWGGYFHYAHSTRVFDRMNHFLVHRVQRWLGRKGGGRKRLWTTALREVLQARWGLHRLPTWAAWKRAPAQKRCA